MFFILLDADEKADYMFTLSGPSGAFHDNVRYVTFATRKYRVNAYKYGLC